MSNIRHLPIISGRGARRSRVVEVAAADLELGRRLYPEEPSTRPRTRGECAEVERPCPHVTCQHHVYLDVSRTGNIRFNFPELEPDQLEDSCVLDVADRGEHTLEEIGAVLGITKERARQCEEIALRKLATAARGLR